MKKISNPSRTTLLEIRVKNLERAVDALALLNGTISTEDTEEEKRLRALKEKGAVKYGD